MFTLAETPAFGKVLCYDALPIIIIEYRSALHAMTLMGDAAASETLIGGIFAQYGGAPPKNSPKRTLG